MKLYDMQRAPNPRRVRIFMAEKGIDIPKIEVDVPGEENLKENFQKKNYRGLVPVLELDDGTCIDESVAICRYLEELYPEPNLLGSDPLSRAQIDSWQRHMEFDGFLSVASVFRNTFPLFSDRGVPGRPAGFKAIPDLAERGRKQFRFFLEDLDKHLANCEYIAGDRFSIADITALVTLDFARVAELEIPQTYKNIHRWYQQVSSRPSAGA